MTLDCVKWGSSVGEAAQASTSAADRTAATRLSLVHGLRTMAQTVPASIAVTAPQHGATMRTGQLGATTETLAQILKESGRKTAGFVANRVLRTDNFNKFI